MTKPWPIPDFDPHAPVPDTARAILAVRAAELFSFDAIFPDAAAVAALHNARIAAKRLRYTLELFPEVFGADGEAVLAEMRTLQEDLGIVHDRDVLIATIDLALGELIQVHDADTDAIRTSLETVLRRVQQERDERHLDVAAQWQRLAQGDFRDRLARLGGTDAIAAP
ncbi:MAG: CHAD domain-containing protein [Thermomicrobiales bacterium]